MRKLERNLLKDQAAQLLRDHIIRGRFSPGAKLTERELAEQLGISRNHVGVLLLRAKQQLRKQLEQQPT